MEDMLEAHAGLKQKGKSADSSVVAWTEIKVFLATLPPIRENDQFIVYRV